MLDYISRLFALLASFAGHFITLPDMGNPSALRAWLQSVCAFAARVATLTTTAIDDTLVKWLSSALADDNTWADLYKLIFAKANVEPPPAVDPNTVPVQVMCTAEELPQSLRASAAAAAIDQDVILQFISALVAFIQSFRKK